MNTERKKKQPQSAIRHMTTLFDALQRWESEKPQSIAISFQKYAAVRELSYHELNTQAREIAFLLKECFTRGTRVVLGFEQEPAYITSFLGCSIAGMVAVTSAPPDEMRKSARLEWLLEDSGALGILTNAAAVGKFDHVAGSVQVIDIDTRSRDQLVPDRSPDPQDLMFLQYTSGSTTAPKGAMVTYAALAANLRHIQNNLGISDQSKFVSWLPLYHDMGLIFMVFAALYCGRDIRLMTPAEFLRRPERWLQAISDCKATITAAPNFAYRLCIERISDEQMATLDLSHLERFLNGSEPVSVRDAEAFYDRFKGTGLKRSALYSAYGMAELVVFACSSEILDRPSYFCRDRLEQSGWAVPMETETADTLQIAPCGLAGRDDLVTRIVDPVTLTPCSHGAIGEVWLSGASVTAGYWGKPEVTQETYHGYTNGREGPFLRTGDMGFILDDCLYISGRMKELIIIRGRNIFPSDVCYAVERSDISMQGRRAAAFSVPSGAGEELVVVCAAKVTSDTWQYVASKIISAVVADVGVLPANVIFVQNRHLLRTTSGKIQHSVIRKHYLAGTLVYDFSLQPIPEKISVP